MRKPDLPGTSPHGNTNCRAICVEIRSEFTPQRLWFAATIDVFLNQGMILTTGGEPKFDGACVDEFEYAGAQHNKVRLEWGKSSFNSFPCTLCIDDIEITQETVAVENRSANLVAMSLLDQVIHRALTHF